MAWGNRHSLYPKLLMRCHTDGVYPMYRWRLYVAQIRFVHRKVGNLSRRKPYRLGDSVAPTALHLGNCPIPSAARWADVLRSLLSAPLFRSAQRTFVSEFIWRDVIYSVLCAGLTCYAPCFSLHTANVCFRAYLGKCYLLGVVRWADISCTSNTSYTVFRNKFRKERGNLCRSMKRAFHTFRHFLCNDENKCLKMFVVLIF